MSDVIIKNLNISYGEKKIFENFSILFPQNKVTVILGGSGIGKTTLLNAIAGSIKYNGEIEGNSHSSYVFQTDRLIPSISIQKNLEYVLYNIPQKERIEKINSALKLVELDGINKKHSYQLSGGECSRVSFLRAFLVDSQVVLMDEPFNGLDISLKNKLCNYFNILMKDYTRTIIYVTHNIDEALMLGDRIVVFKENPITIVEDIAIDIMREEREIFSDELSIIRTKLLKSLTSF